MSSSDRVSFSQLAATSQRKVAELGPSTLGNSNPNTPAGSPSTMTAPTVHYLDSDTTLRVVRGTQFVYCFERRSCTGNTRGSRGISNFQHFLLRLDLQRDGTSPPSLSINAVLTVVVVIAVVFIFLPHPPDSSALFSCTVSLTPTMQRRPRLLTGSFIVIDSVLPQPTRRCVITCIIWPTNLRSGYIT